MPHKLSYDRYLKLIRYNGGTDLSGIDLLIACTEIYDDCLFARLLREKIPMYVYVYSWDHACKHVRFSRQVNYLVWNRDMGEDLAELQKIPKPQIREIGATQFGYLEQYRMQQQGKGRKGNYFYFGCGIGIRKLVAQEIAIIRILADMIREIHPGNKLIVRPYPNFSDWQMYDELLDDSVIQLDNTYRQAGLSVSDDSIMDKFTAIGGARAFFHLGTTLGLETCFTDCPSFLLDIANKESDPISLYHFVHQYQNEKYLIQAPGFNTIRSTEQLKQVLREIDDPKYLVFNQEHRKNFQLKSFDALANEFMRLQP
jgi:hypothetical protein